MQTSGNALKLLKMFNSTIPQSTVIQCSRFLKVSLQSFDKLDCLDCYFL